MIKHVMELYKFRADVCSWPLHFQSHSAFTLSTSLFASKIAQKNMLTDKRPIEIRKAILLPKIVGLVNIPLSFYIATPALQLQMHELHVVGYCYCDTL